MAIGIVAEFNPFHNGHKYLIDEARHRTGDNAVIAVMSGGWVQRGEPAITDKWTRARMALLNGVDLVIELPVIYSLNTAQKFAYGAVAALSATGIVNTLAFGSERGDIDSLKTAAYMLMSEPTEVSDKIKKLLSGGMSFAAARSAAYDGMIPGSILSSPNDILAVEYIRAAAELDAGFELIAIKRCGAAHDGAAVGNIASASEIRRLLSEKRAADKYLPERYFPIYDKAALDAAVIAAVRTRGAEYIKSINDVSEGLENRFIKAAASASTADELCMGVKSKRYTLSRIRRIAYSVLLGITKDIAAHNPSYIRVLGMTARGAEILKQMKITAALPAVIKPAGFRSDEIFDLNSRAEDVFALCAPKAELKHGRRDLTESPVIIL